MNKADLSCNSQFFSRTIVFTLTRRGIDWRLVFVNVAQQCAWATLVFYDAFTHATASNNIAIHGTGLPRSIYIFPKNCTMLALVHTNVSQSTS